MPRHLPRENNNSKRYMDPNVLTINTVASTRKQPKGTWKRPKFLHEHSNG